MVDAAQIFLKQRFVASSLVILLLSSCKLRVVVPEGGTVESKSTTYSCASGQTCEINVVDLFFDESFVAKPASGYKFKFWKKGDKRFCGHKKTACNLSTSGHDPSVTEVISNFLSTEEVFYLQHVFECSQPLTTTANVGADNDVDTPTSTAAELLYVGDFETGEFQERSAGRDAWSVYSQGIEDAIVVETALARKGKHASKFKLEKDDWNGNSSIQGEGKPRAQLVKDNKTLPINFDSDYWLGLSTYMPNDWKADTNESNAEVLWQFHASGGVGPYVPPLALIVRGEVLEIESHFGDVQSQIGTRVHWSCGVQTGEWVDWVVNVRFSLEEGMIRVWRNGEKIVNFSSGPTMFYDSENLERKPLYIGIGLYKPKYVKIPSSVTKRTMYFDEVRVATGGSDGKGLVTPGVSN